MEANSFAPWLNHLLDLQGDATQATTLHSDLPIQLPFVAPGQRPRRTFDSRYSRRYGHPTFEPLRLVRYSPKYGYSRLFNFPYRGSGWRPRMNTLVLQIHGTAVPAEHVGGSHNQAAAGVFLATKT